MSGNEPDLAAPAATTKDIDLAHAELKELGLIGEATTWKNTTYDVLDSEPDAALERTGVLDGELDGELRDRIDAQVRKGVDPDRATIEQAEQPRWGESR
ncbi:hypothetical protein [Streptomyces sp. NPDC093105]|uniref:hypothetical protein n=1 Tax=Streptomyces sp. NPDC093105 TaxID=3366029 RepID=UPI0038154E5D